MNLSVREMKEFRRIRSNYLKLGRRALSGSVGERYDILLGVMTEAIDSLPGIYQIVARHYWFDAMSCVAISFRVHYSDRHVRRLKVAARNMMLSRP